jgi:hypothetical protein
LQFIKSKKWLLYGKQCGAEKAGRSKMGVMNGTKHTSIEPTLLAGKTSRDLREKKNDLPEFPPCSEAVSLYIEEIHNRAETMTPLLREILNFRP